MAGLGSGDGKQFFNGWALWQKMTFVLACAIFITIIIGFIKLFFDRRKLKKYGKAEKGKQPSTPEMLESQPVTQVTTETKDDIPFGIRAIQSGIEVDGVWISRTNTPVASSRASIVSDKLGRSYNNSQLELPQTAMIAPSAGSSRAPSQYDRAVSTERTLANESRSSSPGRGRQQKCSNCNHNVPRNSAALQTLESPRSGPMSGPPSPRHAQPDASGRTSNKSSRRTSDESDYMAIHNDVRAYEHAYIRPTSVQTPIDPRTDLDLLQSHRMSHVAETGQLTPRVRRPGHSGEWASVADQQTSANGVSYFSPSKTPSPPLPASMEEHDVAPDNASQPRRQLTETYVPKAPYYPEVHDPRVHHQYSYDEVPYEVNTEQNQRGGDDQVLRNVNSGFQVLRPGTFQMPTAEEAELESRRQSKKLQKKPRTSQDSRASAFVEQV